MKIASLSLIAIFYCTATLAQNIPPKAQQIEQATMPIAESARANAKVLGYDKSGALVTLREGTNNFICLADNPDQKGFSVACYHKELDEFMARGRALKKEDKSFQEIFDQREKEVKEGKLKMPDKTTLAVVSGKFDDNGMPTNTNLRYVIYIPFATSESTGLPEAPQTAGGAWIMNPGTHRAHIMVTPPAKQ